MKSASIRKVQHELAAILAEVEQGEEIIITRRDQPVARLSPIKPADITPAGPAAALGAYWQQRRLPPAVRSVRTHADLLSEGRGEL